MEYQKEVKTSPILYHLWSLFVHTEVDFLKSTSSFSLFRFSHTTRKEHLKNTQNEANFFQVNKLLSDTWTHHICRGNTAMARQYMFCGIEEAFNYLFIPVHAPKFTASKDRIISIESQSHVSAKWKGCRWLK